MLSFTLLFVLVFFSVLFCIVITSLGEERGGLHTSRAFVCLSCMHYFLFCLFFSSSWCRLWIVIVSLPGIFI